LDSAAERLVIMRIQREGNTNKIKVLENEQILNVCNDTLLRHSNVLDGLFHKRVVLAESDSEQLNASEDRNKCWECKGLCYAVVPCLVLFLVPNFAE